jgi:hypothetical protein
MSSWNCSFKNLTATGSYSLEMAKRHGHWAVLGIDPTQEERAIKRAYAAKLKGINVGDDPKAFIALRAAFEGAREAAKWMQLPQTIDETDDDADGHMVPIPSTAEDEINPKDRVLRFAPQGKLEDKGPSSPPKKIRVKPATVKSGDEQEAPIPARLKVKLNPKKATLSDQNTVDDLDAENKIHFTPKTMTQLDDRDESASKGNVTPLQQAPIWYHAQQEGHNIDAIIARIVGIVEKADGKPVDETALESAFYTLLAASELENIGQRDAIETRIASIALNAEERGHYLVMLAHWHFGWHERADDYDLAWPISEVVALAPALTRLRDLEAGAGRAAWHDEASYRWLIEGPPPRWSPSYWTRRGQINEFIDKTRTETPALLALIGYDRIAAWQEGQITGSRLLLLLAALAYGTFQWVKEFAVAASPDFPLPLWLITISIVVIISGTVLATELATIAREKERYFDYDRDGHNRIQFMALVALGMLALINGLAPPNEWLAVLSVPIAMAIFFFTGNPILRSPQRERSFVIARRMTIGAFFIITMPMMQGSIMLYLQVIVPASFFLWAAARMQESMQIWFNEHHKIRRWMLHVMLIIGAIGILYVLRIMMPTTKSPPPFWYVYAAMLVVVVHDLITPREVEIPGTSFLILPILTLAMVIAFAIPVMMTVLIMRTAPILYVAYRGYREAAVSGHVWRDHGDGYSSGTTFGEITVFGKSLRNEGGGRSIWFWVWMVIIALQVIRLLVNLGGSVAEPETMKTPEVRTNAFEEYRREHPVFDPKTGNFSPEIQKMLDDIEREKQAKAKLEKPMAPDDALPNLAPFESPLPRQ